MDDSFTRNLEDVASTFEIQSTLYDELFEQGKPKKRPAPVIDLISDDEDSPKPIPKKRRRATPLEIKIDPPPPKAQKRKFPFKKPSIMRKKKKLTPIRETSPVKKKKMDRSPLFEISPGVDMRLLKRKKDKLRKEYLSLMRRGNQFDESQMRESALPLFEKAWKIHPKLSPRIQDPSLLSKMNRLKYRKKPLKKGKRLQPVEEFTQIDGTGEYQLDEGFRLAPHIYDKLYPHQKAGVSWLRAQQLRNKGGILADDMGLGKTITISAFLNALFTHNPPRVLIVCPVSVSTNWLNELKKWCPGARVLSINSGGNKNESRYALDSVLGRSGIVVTTFGMVTSSVKTFIPMRSKRPTLFDSTRSNAEWDLIFLDEGHRIKNPDTKLAKAVREIPTNIRFIATGTPVQNSIQELWALFDFIQPKLLGPRKYFETHYTQIIEKGQLKGLSRGEKKAADETRLRLKGIIAPYYLRREKKGGDISTSTLTQLDPGKHKRRSSFALPQIDGKRKWEVTVWIKMTAGQVQKYKKVLQSRDVQSAMETKNPLGAITVLKKCCNHVKLLEKNVEVFEFKLPSQSNTLFTASDFFNACSKRISQEDLTPLLQGSGKLAVLDHLLQNHKNTGHRTVIFSQSKKMLDIIQAVIQVRRYRFLRLDGDVTKSKDRQRMINKFNQDKSYFCFLITTQAGGVGITLTGADRAIIYDPAWNPSVDAQAVDRIFRIGQRRDVLVYRFISCATVEEKMYRKQVFKNSLFRTATKTKSQYRYFSDEDLKEVFQMQDPTRSETMEQLLETHENEQFEIENQEMRDHLRLFQQHYNVLGFTHHDLLFSSEAKEPSKTVVKKERKYS